MDEAWLQSELPGVPFHLFGSWGAGAFVMSAGLWRWLWMKRRDIAVCHVHGLFNPVSSGVIRLCRAGGIPHVVRPFGTLSHYTATTGRVRAKRAYYALIEQRNVACADAIHLTSKREEEEVLERDATLSGRTHVVPPPMGAVRSRRVERRRAKERCNVLYLSRIDRKKNLESLIDSWPLVSATIASARLTIAGDGDPAYVESLKQRARVSGESIEFVGFVQGERKDKLLEAASLFVLPSRHENFGVAVVEAMGAGLPVVISRDVQVADVITRFRLGRISDTTPESLAASVIAALSDDELSERCLEIGAKTIEALYSTDAIGERLEVMYRAVMRHQGPSE